jgi:rare lipoprotein A
MRGGPQSAGLNCGDLRTAWLMVPLAMPLVLALAACGTPPKRLAQEAQTPAATSSVAAPAPKRQGAYYQDDGPGDRPPPNLDAIPDAVPKAEPLRVASNRPYSVFGRDYVPQTSLQPFRQRGVASWYGRKFHGSKTSSGELYDMYAMTAAHPTLPIPSYLKVTSVSTRRSVIVRVNDRGPFHSDRILDLAYAAAHRLGFAQAGSALVEIESIDPAHFTPPTAIARAAAAPAPTAPISAPPLPAPTFAVAPQAASAPAALPLATDASGVFLQLGAFSQRENAESFRARVYRQLGWLNDPIQVRAGDGLFRLQLGPYRDRGEAEGIAQRIHDALDLKPSFIFK